MFVLWQTRSDEPMMPLHVVLDRNRGGSYLVMLIVGAAMFGMFYFVTFFVQQVIGFSALRVGLRVPAGRVHHRHHLAGDDQAAAALRAADR